MTIEEKIEEINGNNQYLKMITKILNFCQKEGNYKGKDGGDYKFKNISLTSDYEDNRYRQTMTVESINYALNQEIIDLIIPLLIQKKSKVEKRLNELLDNNFTPQG